MKIVCLVKFVPNTDNFTYDYETNTIVRENSSLIINPDDASSLEFALKIKDKDPNTEIEVVSMGPMSLEKHLKDILRRNVNKVFLISDKLFMGSDSFVTSSIIGKFLKTLYFDLLLTGTHALDGDTSHVGPQIAEFLDLEQFSNVVNIREFFEKNIYFDADMGDSIYNMKMDLPCVLSIGKEISYKLRHIKYANLKSDVDDRFHILTNEHFNFKESEVGLKGSPTKVVKTFVGKISQVKKMELKNDKNGVNEVYTFLKNRGYI